MSKTAVTNFQISSCLIHKMNESSWKEKGWTDQMIYFIQTKKLFFLSLYLIIESK